MQFISGDCTMSREHQTHPLQNVIPGCPLKARQASVHAEACAIFLFSDAEDVCLVR